MKLVHLTASTFYGGPERQMLGLAQALPRSVTTEFLTFSENGQGRAFCRVADRHGFAARMLRHDTPRFRAMVREVTAAVRSCDLLLCHGYKANLIGRWAARRAGVPVVAVSRGWTGESWKVRLYERIDRRHLRCMDRVVAVSEGQAAKVRRAGVPAEKIRVIRNAARPGLLSSTASGAREALRRLLPGFDRIVLAAGRLSPEKGFDLLVLAARRVPGAGFILFGEGVERPRLARMIRVKGLEHRFLLAGHTERLDGYLPGADVVVLPSRTEGLPNVALEASAAGVPVVATAVGGTPEAVIDGETGFLVPPEDSEALAERINDLLSDRVLRLALGHAGRERMRRQFSFAAQAEQYLQLVRELQAPLRCAA